MIIVYSFCTRDSAKSFRDIVLFTFHNHLIRYFRKQKTEVPTGPVIC